MTVKVYTPDAGWHVFTEAEYFSEHNGVLTLEDKDDSYVAMFAVGQWSFFHTGPEETTIVVSKPKPRQWLEFNDIPDGVRVVDKDGDRWTGDSQYNNSYRDDWGPFIEVLG